MNSSHTEIYRLAEYYDIAFDFRDVPAECDFLVELCRRHMKREPASFLELCAGPAQHTVEFAKRGVKATALDSSEAMLAYAHDKAEAQNAEIECACSDMVDFRLAHRYDLAAILMNSSVYLLDNDAVLKHLHSVADHLNNDGLYVLEMSHPRDVFSTGKSTLNEWEMERDGTHVSFRWGRDDDPFDPITQITDVTVELRFSGPNGSGVVTDSARERCFTANEFMALVTASGRFEIVEMFGSMDVEIPFTNDKAAWRMVPVLRKVG